MIVMLEQFRRTFFIKGALLSFFDHTKLPWFGRHGKLLRDFLLTVVDSLTLYHEFQVACLKAP